MSNKFVDFFKDIKGFRFTSNFFICWNAVQFFAADLYICPNFFLGHESVILKIGSAIFETIFLFSMSSNDRDNNKKLYITSLDLLLNNRDKNFSSFEYLFSSGINSFPWSFFELLLSFFNTSLIPRVYSFTALFIVESLILFQSILCLCNPLHFFG